MVLGILALFGLVLVPGWLAARLLMPRAAAYEYLALGLGLALATSGWLLLAACYLLATRADGPLVLGVLGPLAAAVYGLAWQRRATLGSTDGGWGVLALCLGLGAVYLVNYDPWLFLHGSCLTEDVFTVGTAGLFHNAGALDVRSLTGGQRLGAIAWPLTPYVFMGEAGFRLLYGLDCVLISAACAGLARGLLGTHRWAAGAGALAVLNPYVMQIPVVDENTMALALGSVCLFVALSDRKIIGRAWVCGALGGVLVALRHVLLPAALGPLWLFWRRDGKRQAGWLLLAAIAVLTLAFWHHLTWFDGPAWESRYSVRGQAFGVTFPAYGFSNWPLHDQVVRTPFNPYPTFAMLPLRYLREMGLLLAALTGLGGVALYRKDRSAFVTLVLFAAPVVLILSLLEQWTKPNKMGIVLICFTVPVIFIVAAVQRLLETPWRRAVMHAAVAITAVLGLALLLTAVDVPADARAYERSVTGQRAFHTERPSLLAQQRAALLDFGLLPDVRRLALYSRPFALWKLGAVPVFPVREPVAPREAGRPIQLELTADRGANPAWIGEASGPATMLDSGVVYRVGGALSADWTPDKLVVFLLRRQAILFVVTVFDNTGETAQITAHEQLQILYPGHKYPGGLDERPLPAEDRITLDATGIGHVIAIDVISNADELFWVWEVALEDPMSHAPPRRLYLP